MGIIKFLISRSGRSNKEGNNRKRLSVIAKTVASISVAVSVAVMVIAFAIVGGYRSQLDNTLRGMLGDFKLSGCSEGERWIEKPTPYDTILVQQITTIDGVRDVSGIIQMQAVLQAQGVINGVAVIGMDSIEMARSIDVKFNQEDLNCDFEDGVIISKQLSKKLGLEIGDDIGVIFFRESPIMMGLTLCGTYESHLGEVDNAVVWCSRNKLAQLAGYQNNEIDYYKITANEGFNYELLANELDQFSTSTLVLTDAQLNYSQIYDWVNVLDNNIALLMIIVSIVVGINIISVVLIIILENTMSIGVLKSLGMRDGSIMIAYGLRTVGVVIKGIIWGAILGIGLCLLQQEFGVIELDPSSYLVDRAPIKINFYDLIIVITGALGVAIIFSLLPTFIISKIDPDKTLKFQ